MYRTKRTRSDHDRHAGGATKAGMRAVIINPKRRSNNRNNSAKRQSPKIVLVATHISEYSEVKLAAEEASFLRWLCANGGTGTRSGRNWISNDVRLVRQGYVNAWKETHDVVRYTLAPSGMRALVRYDRANQANPYALSPGPRKKRKNRCTRAEARAVRKNDSNALL
jgi:hypothetical protein